MLYPLGGRGKRGPLSKKIIYKEFENAPYEVIDIPNQSPTKMNLNLSSIPSPNLFNNDDTESDVEYIPRQELREKLIDELENNNSSTNTSATYTATNSDTEDSTIPIIASPTPQQVTKLHFTNHPKKAPKLHFKYTRPKPNITSHNEEGEIISHEKDYANLIKKTIKHCFDVEQLNDKKHFLININWDPDGVFLSLERHYDEKSWIHLTENDNIHFE